MSKKNDLWKPGEFGDMWAKAQMWGALGGIVLVILVLLFSK